MNHNVRKSKQAESSSPWGLDPRLRAELGSSSPSGSGPTLGSRTRELSAGSRPMPAAQVMLPILFCCYFKVVDERFEAG